MSGKSLTGKTCLITGATSGIGKYTALGIAKLGAAVVIIGRNAEKCKATVDKIKWKTKNESVEYILADLSCQKEIRNLVKKFENKYNTLHVLVNNAGARFIIRQETVDGIEMTFALNHLAYFLLTNLLLDVLKNSTPARIINIASGNLSNSIDFNNLNQKENYDGRKAYAQSKLANLLFTYELAQKLKNSDITVNAVNPGGVATNFNRNNGWQYWLRHVIAHIISGNLKLPRRGAYASIYLASSPEVNGVTGRFFHNDQIISSSELLFDRDLTKKLWTISEQLTGL